MKAKLHFSSEQKNDLLNGGKLKSSVPEQRNTWGGQNCWIKFQLFLQSDVLNPEVVDLAS